MCFLKHLLAVTEFWSENVLFSILFVLKWTSVFVVSMLDFNCWFDPYLWHRRGLFETVFRCFFCYETLPLLLSCVVLKLLQRIEWFFQLMKVAFDDEVSSDEVENLKKMLARMRSPEHISLSFAFTGGCVLAQSLPMHKAKEKNATLK